MQFAVHFVGGPLAGLKTTWRPGLDCMLRFTDGVKFVGRYKTRTRGPCRIPFAMQFTTASGDRSSADQSCCPRCGQTEPWYFDDELQTFVCHACDYVGGSDLDRGHG